MDDGDIIDYQHQPEEAVRNLKVRHAIIPLLHCEEMGVLAQAHEYVGDDYAVDGQSAEPFGLGWDIFEMDAIEVHLLEVC